MSDNVVSNRASGVNRKETQKNNQVMAAGSSSVRGRNQSRKLEVRPVHADTGGSVCTAPPPFLPLIVKSSQEALD